MVKKLILSTLTIVLIFNLAACDSGSETNDSSSKAPPPNIVPTADAGEDKTTNENTNITLTGVGVDVDGTVESYSWVQVSGPQVTISNTGTAVITFKTPEITGQTNLTFKFTVTDNEGESSSDLIDITVNNVNKMPIADATYGQSNEDNTVIILTGIASDTDGTISSYDWQQVSGIPVTILNSNTAEASFYAPSIDERKELVFELTVTDNEGLSSAKQLTVVVYPIKSPVSGELLVSEQIYNLAGYTDSLGIIDITEILVENGYVLENSQITYGIQVQNDSNQQLGNVKVEFFIEKEKDIIHLRVVDDNNNYAELIQSEDLRKLLEEAKNAYVQSYETTTFLNNEGEIVQVIPAFRFLLQIIMRSYRLVEVIDTGVTIYNLFNLDIGFKRYDNETYFEGSIGDFYNLYSGLNAGLRLPITLNRFVSVFSSKLTASRVIRSNENDLLDYVKNVAGYVTANSDTKIRVKIHSTNDRNRLFSFEIMDNTAIGSLYDISISAIGNDEHAFDFGSDPDFKGWVIVKGASFEFKMTANEVIANTTLKNVPLEKNDIVTVSLIDEDLFFDDEVIDFQFNFSGNNYVTENELARISLEFTSVTNTKPDYPIEQYDVTVIITGDDTYNFDIFGNPPDFRGSIIFDENSFELEVKENSYVATYSFENVGLSIGDFISIYIEDKDLTFHDKIMERQFIFDGNDHLEANDKITVRFQFTRS